jgi:hypothetical protein
MLYQPDAHHYDICPDPTDMPRCVTPNPNLSMMTMTQNLEQMIDTKMQHQWREDMRPTDWREMLQEQTNHFLGKQPDIVLYNLSSNMIAEMTLLLPPVIVNPQAWQTSEGPSLRGTTWPTRYSSMTTQHLETPQGSLSLSLVKSLLTNHFEPRTPVLASGDEHRLTYAQVLTRPAYGPGGFTNDGLCK